MTECGSISPVPNHKGATCNLDRGHSGLHWRRFFTYTLSETGVIPWDAGGMFWTEDEVRHSRKIRVRLGRWLSRD